MWNWLTSLLGGDPPDVHPRGLVPDETPKQSVGRVAEHFRGRKVYVKYVMPMGGGSALSELATDILRRFESRLRDEGAVVDIRFDDREFTVSFSWHDQPLFTFASQGRESKLRAVRWQRAGRARRIAMMDDTLVQGLYFCLVGGICG